MKGSDTFGSWSAEGYILTRYDGIFVWFYKEYDNKKGAGQTGKWAHLVHESEWLSFNPNQYDNGNRQNLNENYN